ncbi:threonine--tRNA ligase [Candidatus Roizmanbacteria bacterium]|nr:threonine--tRNA ligase [Candidatus Roizmanbacteria bacterium]
MEHIHNLRHSTAHLLAAAVLELFPGTKPTIGPVIDNGFYYDFDFAEPISEKDLGRIDQKMRELVKKWDGFHKSEVSAEEALKKVQGNEYKEELIKELAEKNEPISFYQSGNFEDLCRGGHVDNPKEELKYFKLLSIAGAYWRGSEKNKMLTRIYGVAFESKEALEEHLAMLEEAKKRDHRKLGKELELFFIDEMVGKGLVMWLPKGTIVRDQIEELAKKKEKEAGYLRVATPHIAREELYITSGHLPYYKDSMYPEMKMDDGTYYLKGMNCPHHHRMFVHRPRSYKEMPVRFAEYGMCYRYELSGTLAGLLRVRAMAMNDAHIYTTKAQIKQEFAAVLKLVIDYFKIFKLENYWFRLSKWDPKHTEKYINEPENWEYAQNVIREILQEMKLPFKEVDDEAAFYGPKVDVQFKSIVGREETMSTIQLDFAAKKRFGLSYIDEEGKENTDVFVIHRAPLSTQERFLAFLLEHYAGAFPTWLAPVQVSVLPVSDKFNEYAQKVYQELLKNDIRVEINEENKTLGAKIRESTLQKVPYMIIIGATEVSDSSVSIRTREGKDLGKSSIIEFIQTVKNTIEKYE